MEEMRKVKMEEGEAKPLNGRGMDLLKEMGEISPTELATEQVQAKKPFPPPAQMLEQICQKILESNKSFINNPFGPPMEEDARTVEELVEFTKKLHGQGVVGEKFAQLLLTCLTGFSKDPFYIEVFIKACLVELDKSLQNPFYAMSKITGFKL